MNVCDNFIIFTYLQSNSLFVKVYSSEFWQIQNAFVKQPPQSRLKIVPLPPKIPWCPPL